MPEIIRESGSNYRASGRNHHNERTPLLSMDSGTCGGAHMMTKLWQAHVTLPSTVDNVQFALLRCRRQAQWHTDVRQLL